MATLRQLLDLPALDLHLVQAGAGDPELSWVSTTELRGLAPYLDGGEVVLTTGLDFSADDPGWRDFVADLSRARIAAIGFGTGVVHERIPVPLLTAVSTYRVALFEVPAATRFIAIGKAVAALLRSDELRSAQHALRTQQRLLSAGHGGHDPAEVLASISQVTGRHLALLSPADTVLASTAGFDPLTLVSGGGRGELEVIELDQDGSLRLAVSAGDPLSPEGRAVISAGAVALGLRARDRSAAEAAERARWQRLCEAMLSGGAGVVGSGFAADAGAGGAAVAALQVLDPEAAPPQRVRAIAVQGSAEAVSEWRQSPRTGLERLVMLDPATHAAAQTRAPGTVLAWQLCPADDAGDALDRALALAAHHGLDTAVGRVERLSDAALSAVSARALLGGLSPAAALYEAPRAPRTVSADQDAPILELFITDAAGAAAAQVLGPLFAASAVGADSGAGSGTGPDSGTGTGTGVRDAAPVDAATRALLRQTLRTALEHDGNRAPAAVALGIHRNTLRDRLTRIEALTGRSLANADHRAELWFALRLSERAEASGN